MVISSSEPPPTRFSQEFPGSLQSLVTEAAMACCLTNNEVTIQVPFDVDRVANFSPKQERNKEKIEVVGDLTRALDTVLHLHIHVHMHAAALTHTTYTCTRLHARLSQNLVHVNVCFNFRCKENELLYVHEC